MRDLFLIIDDAGNIECAGPAVSLLFGYAVPDMLGQPAQQFLEFPARNSVVTAPFVWLSAAPNPILHGIHKDGRRFPLRLTQHEIQGAGQTHVVLMLQDPARAPAVQDVFLQHKELYELATTQGRISVWEVDYRTNHLEFSPVLAQMLGLSDEQIPTSVEAWSKQFHPDDWQALERESGRMLRREIPEINVECRMVRADGQILWTLVRGHASFDEHGQPIKQVGTSIDITERKRAEQRATVEHAVARVLAAAPTLANASRLILQAICEALDWEAGTIWCVDAAAQVLRCVRSWHQSSAAVEEFESVSRDTTFAPGVGLPGRVWPSRKPAWILDVVQDANFPRAQFAAKVGLHGALAFPILLDETVLGVIEFFSRDVKEPDQDLLHMMAAIGSQLGQFIERRKAEEERDRFFTLSLDLLCILDTQAIMRRVNPAFTRVFGYTPDELVGHSSFEFNHPDDIEPTKAAIGEVMRGKDVDAFENRARHKDGTIAGCPGPAPHWRRTRSFSMPSAAMSPMPSRCSSSWNAPSKRPNAPTGRKANSSRA